MSKSKYRNRKTRGYASAREAARARELHLMEYAGTISSLREQVPYELVPAQYESVPRYGKNGKRLRDKRVCVERAVVYRADFVYTDARGETVVEDAKGMRTKEYIIKRKLMLWRFGIRVREV